MGVGYRDVSSEDIKKAIEDFDNYKSSKYKHGSSIFGSIGRAHKFLKNAGQAASIAITVPYVIEARRKNIVSSLPKYNKSVVIRNSRRITPMPTSGIKISTTRTSLIH